MFNKVEKKSKRKESHHHFNEEAKCVRCGITISEVQSVFCREKNMLNDYLEESKLLPQDTPEEWEEKQRNLIEKAQEKYFDFRRREQLLDGDVEIYRNTREYVEKELVEDIINFTKQLLKERERWAIDTFLKDTASYNSFHNGRPRTMRNGLSGEGFEVRVSKLSKKK